MKSLFENTTLTWGLNLLKISFGSRNEDNEIFEDVEELLELLLRLLIQTIKPIINNHILNILSLYFIYKPKISNKPLLTNQMQLKKPKKKLK